MKSPLPPVIKWPGSKHAVASQLAGLFPKCDRFVDPFVGGGSMLMVRPIKAALACDVVPELIALWREIQVDPERVANEYEDRWVSRQRRGASVYYEIRDRFNQERSPHDLLFLSRTCVNGLIRFNSRNEFNNSLHHTRPGIAPRTLREVLNDWSRTLAGVTFDTRDYVATLRDCSRADFVFLDPPYMHTRGRYVPTDFDFRAFFDELYRLNDIGVRWMLTFDGRAGGRRYEAPVPRELFLSRTEIRTGLSPFTRLMRESQDAVVESVYLNFEPPTKRLTDFSQERSNPGTLSSSQHLEDSHPRRTLEIQSKDGVDVAPLKA